MALGPVASGLSTRLAHDRSVAAGAQDVHPVAVVRTGRNPRQQGPGLDRRPRRGRRLTFIQHARQAGAVGEVQHRESPGRHEVRIVANRLEAMRCSRLKGAPSAGSDDLCGDRHLPSSTGHPCVSAPSWILSTSVDQGRARVARPEWQIRRSARNRCSMMNN